MGTRGAVTSATPTADLSHPIASHLVIGTEDSVQGTRAATAPRLVRTITGCSPPRRSPVAAP